jgi:feruloyl-CoA synthase
VVRDVAIGGFDRDEVGVLVFPDLQACAACCGYSHDEATPQQILTSESLRSEFRNRLRTFAALSTGSSNCVTRALLMEEPPSLDGGELTDKGSLNQRAVLERRADLVQEMYSQGASNRVVRLTRALK